MMAVAIAACTFTSCEDVPEPYNNPYKYLGTDTKVDPQGEGTLASPFNVAAALAKCEEVGETGTTEDVYATGYITELTEVSAQYGNATFKIADKKEGGDALTVYRAKGFKGENITDESLLHVGDSVVICGKLVNFKNNTPEFTQGCYIVSINGKGGGDEPGPEPETVGTKDAPKTVAEALAAINALETENKDTEESWYIKGKVKQVITTDANITQYKNIDYIITDDGTNELKVFRGKYLDNADFTVDNKVKVDDEVIILGKLQKYVKDGNTTPEVTGSYVVVLNGGGDTPNPPAPSDFEAGQYLFIYNQNGTYKVGTPVASDKDYGYMLFADAKITENKLDNDEANLFTFTATEGGFTLQDASGRYYYMDGQHKSFQVSATMPESNFVWTVSTTSDGTATIKNAGTGMTIQYVAKYNEFTATDSGDGLPLLLKPGAEVNGDTSGEGGNEGGEGGDETTDVTGTGTVSGNTLTINAAEFGFAKGNATSTTLVDGTKIYFDKNTGSTVPAYYDGDYASVRVYANNTVTIKASKNITKIEITTTDPSSSDKYNGSDGAFAEGGSTKVNISKESDTKVSFSGLNSADIKITNYNEANSKNQLRIKQMVITYAE